MRRELNPIQFYHLRINNIDTMAVLDFIDTQIEARHTQAKSIFFLNSYYFNLSLKSIPYQQALSDAELLLNDGIGVKIASVLQGIDRGRVGKGIFSPFRRQAPALTREPLTPPLFCLHRTWQGCKMGLWSPYPLYTPSLYSPC